MRLEDLYEAAVDATVDLWWEWAGATHDADTCWGPELDELTEAEQDLHGVVVLVPTRCSLAPPQHFPVSIPRSGATRLRVTSRVSSTATMAVAAGASACGGSSTKLELAQACRPRG
jgi:hypothetical protein